MIKKSKKNSFTSIWQSTPLQKHWHKSAEQLKKDWDGTNVQKLWNSTNLNKHWSNGGKTLAKDWKATNINKNWQKAAKNMKTEWAPKKVKKIWNKTDLNKHWNSSAKKMKKDWDNTKLRSHWQKARSQFKMNINWQEHNPIFLSVFVMISAIFASLIYLSYAQVADISNYTQASVVDTIYPTSNVSIIVKYDDQFQEYQSKLYSKNSHTSLMSILKDLEDKNHLELDTSISNNSIILTGINNKVSRTNGKSWKIYVNNDKTEQNLEDIRLKGNDNVILSYE